MIAFLLPFIPARLAAEGVTQKKALRPAMNWTGTYVIPTSRTTAVQMESAEVLDAEYFCQGLNPAQNLNLYIAISVNVGYSPVV